MELTIDLSPAEEARLRDAAKSSGVAPAELARRLVSEHLPQDTTRTDADVDAKLRLWQQQDGTVLAPDVPTRELFARWAKEDASMTDEERKGEDRLWAELEPQLSSRRIHLGGNA